jgi:hypothetical protein
MLAHYHMPRGRQNLQAHDGIRTRDLFLTKEVLYRLSYMSVLRSARANGAEGGNRTRVISLEN